MTDCCEKIAFYLSNTLHRTANLFGCHVESVKVPSRNLNEKKKRLCKFINHFSKTCYTPGEKNSVRVKIPFHGN